MAATASRCPATALQAPCAAASGRPRGVVVGYGRRAHRPDAAMTPRIRRPPPRRAVTAAARVTCAYSSGAERITACSWNEYVICSDVPVLVEFWASWCGPCRMVTRLVDEIAQEYAGKIKCYRLDADDYPQTATSNDIDRIPTVTLQGWRESTKYYWNSTKSCLC